MAKATQSDITRRQAIGLLCGAAAAGFTACAPMRIALRQAPAEFKHNRNRVDAVLRMFVATVIPGADVEDDNLARIYTDDTYPFAPYAATFVADLQTRAQRISNGLGFEQMELAARTQVIQEGLNADFATRKLYTGAVFIAQVSYYAGIYTDNGCSMIQFDGHFVPGHEITYRNTQRFATRALTRDGNYA
jgi:hypothetical protein